MGAPGDLDPCLLEGSFVLSVGVVLRLSRGGAGRWTTRGAPSGTPVDGTRVGERKDRSQRGIQFLYISLGTVRRRSRCHTTLTLVPGVVPVDPQTASTSTKIRVSVRGASESRRWEGGGRGSNFSSGS